MLVDWLEVALTAVVVLISLAALIYSGRRALRQEIQQIAAQQREDIAKLEGTMGRRFEQLEDTMGRRFEQLEGIMDRRFEQLEGTMDRRFEQLEGTMDRRFEQQREDIGAVTAQLAEVTTRLAELGERTAYIEGLLAERVPRRLHEQVAQAVFDDKPEE